MIGAPSGAALVAGENEANFTDFVQGFTSGYGGGTRPAGRGFSRAFSSSVLECAGAR
jgi:hypothetical protein